MRNPLAVGPVQVDNDEPRTPRSSPASPPAAADPLHSEEAEASVVSRSVFAWVLPLLSRGWGRKAADESISELDLLQLPSDESPHTVHAAFAEVWQREIERAAANDSDPSLLWALLVAFRRDVFVSGLFRLLSLCSLAMPFFLRFFVQWMKDYSDAVNAGSVHAWQGFVWALAISFTALVSNMLINQHAHFSFRAFSRMRSACALASFDKALRLFPDHGLNGLVAQMHSSDNFKFFETYNYFHWLWIAPLQIVVSLVCLYLFIGWSGVISVGVMIVGVPLQSLFLGKVSEYQKSISKCADRRQGLLREIVRGMRIIKFMNLEAPMTARVEVIRAEEECFYDKLYAWKGAAEALGTAIPLVVTLVVFIAAWLLGDPITSASLFSTMVMLQMLRVPVLAVTQAAAKFDELQVSCRRIQNFLLFDECPTTNAGRDGGVDSAFPDDDVLPGSPSTTLEKDPTVDMVTALSSSAFASEAVCADDSENSSSPFPPRAAITLSNVTVLREVGPDLVHSMTGVNLAFPKDALTIIYGPTGSGKSLILKSILKEVRLAPGSIVSIAGASTAGERQPIAYVAQDAYLRRGTVRDNVLFGATYDADRFEKAAATSQLAADLAIMEDGDQTALMDRGSNLSGGQRQRIAIARAAYSHSDVLLLDDPLSALDPRVAHKLFDECICGWMANRTRVLVTHQADLLPRADKIILMKDLEVAFSGTWKELSDGGEPLRALFPKSVRCSIFGEFNAARKISVLTIANRMAAAQARNRQQSHDLTNDDAMQVDEVGVASEVMLASPNTTNNTVEGLPERKRSLRRFVSSFKFRIATHFTAMTRKPSMLDVFRASMEMSSKDRANLEATIRELFSANQSTSLATASDFDGASTSFQLHSGEIAETKGKRKPNKRVVKSDKEEEALPVVVASDPSEDHEDHDEHIPSPLAWFLSNHSWFYVVLTVALSLVQRGANIVTDLILSYWAARKILFGSTPDDDGYATWYGAASGITILLLLLRYTSYALGSSVAVRRTHRGMFTRLVHAPVSFFDQNALGAIVGRFARDLDCVDRTIVEQVNLMYFGAALVIGSCALMCYAAPYLIALLIGVACIYAAVLAYYQATIMSLRFVEATSRAPMVSIIGEALWGLETLRSYKIGSSMRAEHLEAYTKSARSLYNIAYAQLWFNQQLGLINAGIILTMTLLVAGLMTSYDYANRASQLPTLSLAVTYTVSLSLGFLVNLFAEIQNLFVSVDRVAEYATSIEQERGAPSRTNKAAVAAAASDDWPQRGAIEFSGVSLRYRPDLPLALNKLSLTIHPGEHVGVVGRTGSGKSTVVQALFRLVEPVEGRVRIDGVATNNLRLGHLRSKMTIVPQDPMLFKGTVRSNIDPLTLYTDDKVERALRRVGLYDAETFTLDSEVEESGENLSTGQRQLLCLARAMVQKNRILVMDEATANVDGATDERMQDIVRTEFASLTSITIAHRLATIIECDRILVLDRGTLVEFDAPRNLLADRTSTFYQIAESLGTEQLEELMDQAEAVFNKRNDIGNALVTSATAAFVAPPSPELDHGVDQDAVMPFASL